MWGEPLATGWTSGLEWAAEWQSVLQLQSQSASPCGCRSRQLPLPSQSECGVGVASDMKGATTSTANWRSSLKETDVSSAVGWGRGRIEPKIIKRAPPNSVGVLVLRKSFRVPSDGAWQS